MQSALKKPRTRNKLQRAVRAVAAKSQLDAFEARPEIWSKKARSLRGWRDYAAQVGKCSLANSLWYRMTVCDAKFEFCDAFRKIGIGEYYEGWCALERAELACLALARNCFISEAETIVQRLLDQIREWQKLFPYKVFISPEFIIHREECSICGNPTDPWSKCRHETSKVYCGRMCYRIVKKMALGNISLVLDPVQKYSVVFVKGEDQFSYNSVRWVRERVNSAFDGFRVDQTRIFRPPPADLSMDQDCPCGSYKTYLKCCSLNAEGISQPHINIIFEKPPPATMSNYVFFEKS